MYTVIQYFTLYTVHLLLAHSVGIHPLNTGDKSLKVRQEYNINVGKISFNKRKITA